MHLEEELKQDEAAQLAAFQQTQLEQKAELIKAQREKLLDKLKEVGVFGLRCTATQIRLV